MSSYGWYEKSLWRSHDYYPVLRTIAILYLCNSSDWISPTACHSVPPTFLTHMQALIAMTSNVTWLTSLSAGIIANKLLIVKFIRAHRKRPIPVMLALCALPAETPSSPPFLTHTQALIATTSNGTWLTSLSAGIVANKSNHTTLIWPYYSIPPFLSDDLGNTE